MFTLRTALPLRILLLHSLLIFPIILLLLLFFCHILDRPLSRALDTPSCIIRLKRLLAWSLPVLLAYAVDFGAAGVRVGGFAVRGGAAVDGARGRGRAEGLECRRHGGWFE
jgi:hypothetical protein